MHILVTVGKGGIFLKKKAYALFCILSAFLVAAVFSIANVSGSAEYVAAAEGQSVYQLNVAQTRGGIYDCRLRPLVSEKKHWVAAVAPTIEAIGALEKATNGKYRQRLAAALEDGKPFLIPLEQEVDSPFIDMFRVPERYSENQLAPHIIGYLDGMGSGVSGVELAMNDVLEDHSGKALVYYQVDALGRVVAGGDRQAVDTLRESQGGAVLTLDADIQSLIQEVSGSLGRGAVVVTEVPGCEIRGLASFPDYSPASVEAAARDPDSPLVNRAFCAYAPGSVFKLVSAAAKLESGETTEEYNCTGSINAGGLLFHCIDGRAHGKVNLQEALEKSCNCYFINCARTLGGQTVLNTAYNLGLGVEQEFGRGLFSEPGNLPEAVSLENARALANFAFGQGELTVTPVQMCGMINAIASGGVYSTPKLIAGTVNSDMKLTEAQSVTDKALRVTSALTAGALQNYMESTALEGTAVSGAPDNCTAGIKTGTAQTGVYEGTEELLHFWYCGYVCDETGPRYCITVLRESVTEDHGVTARVFRRVAEGLGGLMAQGSDQSAVNAE